MERIKHYAGIGSRSTPQDILDAMYEVGAYLAQKGYILRSGGAEGADEFFEKGCDSKQGRKQIFLPWKGFRDNDSSYIIDNMENKEEAFRIAEEFHPRFSQLRPSVKNLMGRNSYQILGEDLKTPCNFVVCYCIEDYNGDPSGGTGQAIRIARKHNVKVYNLFREEDLNKINKKLK